MNHPLSHIDDVSATGASAAQATAGITATARAATSRTATRFIIGGTPEKTEGPGADHGGGGASSPHTPQGRGEQN